MSSRPIQLQGSAPGLDHPRVAAEFFAGIGLMRLGLERAGWKVAFANDIAADKKQMYERCFADSPDHFHLGDIHALPVAKLPPLGLATASFPCTDLSLAGMRDGLGGKQSSAYWGFVRILRELRHKRPPLILLENVPGFLTSNKGKDFYSALKSLNELGYSLDAFVIDAARFVPQSRVRLFVVGVRLPMPGAAVRDTSSFNASELRPKALATFVSENPDIDWNIRDLPPLPIRKTTLRDILEDLPEDYPGWWSEGRVDYLRGQMSARHTALLESMLRKRRWSYGTVFRRVRHGKSMAELRCDGIAGCLRTPKGGSGRQILVQAGYGKLRARLLTPRECARLMGADEFPIEVPLNQALFGFGDAVCVPVVEWIGNHYLTPLYDEIAMGAAAANG